MTSFLVIDASVAVKWFLREDTPAQDTANALSILEGGLRGEYSLLQPAHWHAEIAAVLSRESPATVAADIRDFLLFSFVRIAHTSAVYERATGLAISLRHHVFDTLYHAVALVESAILITADERYYRKAQGLGHIKLLRDLA